MERQARVARIVPQEAIVMKTRIAALFFLSCFAVASLPARASCLQTRNKAVARLVFDDIFNQCKYQVADKNYTNGFVNHGVQRDVGLQENQDAALGWKLAFPD